MKLGHLLKMARSSVSNLGQLASILKADSKDSAGGGVRPTKSVCTSMKYYVYPSIYRVYISNVFLIVPLLLFVDNVVDKVVICAIFLVKNVWPNMNLWYTALEASQLTTLFEFNGTVVD